MSDPQTDRAEALLVALDGCIAEVLRGLDWTPDASREGNWLDPASGRSVMASTAIATVRREVRDAKGAH